MCTLPYSKQNTSISFWRLWNYLPNSNNFLSNLIGPGRKQAYVKKRLEAHTGVRAGSCIIRWSPLNPSSPHTHTHTGWQKRKKKKHLTCITCNPTPWRHHGQQPLEHDAFNVPENGAVPYSQGLKQHQVQAVGWDGYTVVDEHKSETEHGSEENPDQFPGPIQELCHPDTHRLQKDTRTAAVSLSYWLVSQDRKQVMCATCITLSALYTNCLNQSPNLLIAITHTSVHTL